MIKIAPFRSEKQRKYLWMKHPEIAKKWTKEHGSKIVPSKKNKKKKSKNKSSLYYKKLILAKQEVISMAKTPKPLYRQIRYDMPPPSKVIIPDTEYNRRKKDYLGNEEDDVMEEVREILERKKRSEARLSTIKKIS